MKTNYDRFKDITNDMLVMYTEKNEKYGNSWEETLDEFGYLPYIIRMNEKLKRANTIVTSGDDDDTESLEDILIDISIYSVMTLMHLKNDEPLDEKELYNCIFEMSDRLGINILQIEKGIVPSKWNQNFSIMDLYKELEEDGE